MIAQYFDDLDTFIVAAEEIQKVEILRRSIRDTDLEIVGIYRYRISLQDGGMLEMTERLVEEDGVIARSKYRYHWQTREGKLLKRWDNARHHPEIKTFPHHMHAGAESTVHPHPELSGMQVLSIIIKEINESDTNRTE